MENYPTSQGKTTIAPDVLLTIAQLTTLSVPGVNRLGHVPSIRITRFVKKGYTREGVQIAIIDDKVFTELYVILDSGANIRDVSRTIQNEVSRSITEMVGMQVGRVDVHIVDVEFPMEIKA